MSTDRMPIPVKKSPRCHDVFVTYVQFIATCLTGHASFVDPPPSVKELGAKADELAQANVKAKTRAPGLVADRNDKRKNLEGDLDHLLDYVQLVIKAQALDPAAATTLILSAGLSIRKVSTPYKRALATKHGLLPGEVLLVARAVTRTAMYFWEYSLDQVNWRSAPGTIQARTTVTGLTPGQLYFFRFRAHGRKGPGAYSDVVSCRAL